MKTVQPSPSSWQFYTNSIKESLGRPLTDKECSLCMQRYIHSISCQDVIKELQEKQ